jgi:cytochrome c
MFRGIVVGALLASLCAGSAFAGDAAAGEKVFKANCAICHSPVAGKNLIGPSLFGVVGRHAGTVPDYAYTTANKNSGDTWDEATLDKYLTNPMKFVPGTKMTFAGLKNATQRADVIAYLATLQ